MNNNYNNDRARGGSNNSYGSGFADDSFSGYNDYSGNTFGGSNDYSGNTFGGDDNYDPNAPLYHPEPMTYDPNAPLYRPENNTPVSSYSSSAVKTQKTPVQTIAIVALLIAAAVVIGIVCYKVFFDKKSIKQYFDTTEGQTALAEVKDRVVGTQSVKDAKIYVEGEDVLVYDITFDVTSVSDIEKSLMKKSMEIREPSLKRDMNEKMSKEKIKPFSIKYLFRLSNGEEFFDHTIAM